MTTKATDRATLYQMVLYAPNYCLQITVQYSIVHTVQLGVTYCSHIQPQTFL
jgi:hypothetical protein